MSPHPCWAHAILTSPASCCNTRRAARSRRCPPGCDCLTPCRGPVPPKTALHTLYLSHPSGSGEQVSHKIEPSYPVGLRVTPALTRQIFLPHPAPGLPRQYPSRVFPPVPLWAHTTILYPMSCFRTPHWGFVAFDHLGSTCHTPAGPSTACNARPPVFSHTPHWGLNLIDLRDAELLPYPDWGSVLSRGPRC